MVKVLGNHRDVCLSPTPTADEWARNFDESQRYANAKKNEKQNYFTRLRYLFLWLHRNPKSEVRQESGRFAR
jgi:hypothetical protein